MKNTYTKNQSIINNIITEVKKAVIGKNDVIIKTLLAMLAGGHILVEDIPGVGKTTMAIAFSKAMSLEYNRMQFTPDVLPTDITGFSLYNKNTGHFEYKPGVAICNLFLADEINRTSSKTQSALLQIMEEGNITVDGKTYHLPRPYTVIATQNPVGSIGTQMLPESQLDRFMIKINMGYPDLNSEVEILKSKLSSKKGYMNLVKPAVTAEDFVHLQRLVYDVYIDDSVLEYIARLSDATRHNKMIELGISPRGSVSLAAISRALAMVHGRDYVIPDDIAWVFLDVCEHRLILDKKAALSNITAKDILKDIIKSVKIPSVSI